MRWATWQSIPTALRRISSQTIPPALHSPLAAQFPGSIAQLVLTRSPPIVRLTLLTSILCYRLPWTGQAKLLKNLSDVR